MTNGKERKTPWNSVYSVVSKKLKRKHRCAQNENSRNRFISDYGSKDKADFSLKSYT